MKWKKDAEIVTSDFWYDITDGGYIVPSELLEDETEIEEVEKAIEVLRNFRQSAEENEILEYL